MYRNELYMSTLKENDFGSYKIINLDDKLKKKIKTFVCEPHWPLFFISIN